MTTRETVAPEAGWRLKRAVDIALGALGTVAFTPVMAVVALLIRCTMGRPVLFKQERLGLNGEPFSLLKFRSMSVPRDPSEGPLLDEFRTTALGAVLRRTRLDELPAFWLVWTGRLSMVGPRPLPPSAYHHEADHLRLAVKPGFTGLAQVSGNTLLSTSEKFALDLMYAREANMALDLKILLLTAWTLIRGERRNEGLIRRAVTGGQSLA